MISIKRHNHGWLLETEQLLPAKLEETFEFFADAANLQALTPSWLHFKIITPQPVDMHVGSLIDYRLRLHGIPLNWRTEITGWHPPFSFVDTQLRGPYLEWVHTHTFEAAPHGTWVRDHVYYRVPGGRLVHWLLVRRDIERIFQFREHTLAGIFSSNPVARDDQHK